MDEQLKQMVFNKVSGMMSYQYGDTGLPLRWFFCFGTLLRFIRHRGEFCITQDIDVGVLYEECDSEKMVNSMANSTDYELESVFLHDVTNKPLNAHFMPSADSIKGTPSIDLYFWYPSGNMLYHTYDVKRECKSIPSKYYLKGVKRRWMRPDQDTIKLRKKSGPEGERLIDELGVWHYDIFGDHSGYTFPVPFAYGSLLDEWYPGWFVEDRNFGQSKSTWTKEVKSMKKL